MLRSSLGSQSQPSAHNFRDELSLLQRKDQQIRRLQNQLQQQKRRADSAVKMLQSFKAIHQKYEEGGQTLRGEINRRLKVEEELKKQQQRNTFLQEGIRKYIEMLKQSHPSQQIDDNFERFEYREKR